MKREKSLEEMVKSLIGGGLIGIIAMFAVAKHMRNPLEMLAYWVATWGIASYGVWFVIDLIDTHKKEKP